VTRIPPDDGVAVGSWSKRVQFPLKPQWVLVVTLVLSATATPSGAQPADGAALFDRHCATCHAGAGVERAPSQAALRERTPGSILAALVNGVMIAQGANLSDSERRSIAEYLSGQKLSDKATALLTGRCASSPPLTDPTRSPQWNGWGATASNTRFQPTDQAGLTADRVPALRLKWAFGFPGASSARAQPAVAGGRVFVGSEAGVVYSLDARTGCIHWVFAARAGVRTAMTVAERFANGATPAYTVYLGDLNAHVYALDAATGALLWVRKIDDHPQARVTGSPTLYGGRLYVPVAGVGEEGAASGSGYACCTFRGSIVALEAATGTIRWKTYTIDEAPALRGKTARGEAVWGPSGASIWSSPTIDPKRRVLYAGTGNMFSGPQKRTSDAILAIDLESGAVKWVNQRTPGDISIGGCRDRYARRPNCPEQVGPDLDFASSPMLITLPGGRDIIIAGQKSGVAWALDPDRQGAVLWQYRAGEGGPMGGIEWGTATDGEQAYIAIADDQSSIFSRAVDVAGNVPGGLHAVRLATGDRAWLASPRPPLCGSGRGCSAAQSAAITTIPGVVFSGSIDGGIRAFSTRDGALLWEFDTNREFETVNGVKAKGASIGGPGPVVVDGILYVNSGYSTGGRPGNVLLAFEAGTKD
jgi:polyvinyl alcohol dehydrogenase (cytochrome)